MSDEVAARYEESHTLDVKHDAMIFTHGEQKIDFHVNKLSLSDDVIKPSADDVMEANDKMDMEMRDRADDEEECSLEVGMEWNTFP